MMKLKVCGMKYPENIVKVAALQPDYLGFIFYDKSPRNFEGIIPELPKSIKKVGVFVNEQVDIVVSLVAEYQLACIQLHGEESVAYINTLQEALRQASLFGGSNGAKAIKICKVFGIKDEFDFSQLQPYEKVVDYFLFDTKGKHKGGNGVAFNWRVLEQYNSEKPFILSGGIGLDVLDDVQSFFKTKSSKKCIALDINSKFEVEAGIKSAEKIKTFKNSIKQMA